MPPKHAPELGGEVRNAGAGDHDPELAAGTPSDVPRQIECPFSTSPVLNGLAEGYRRFALAHLLDEVVAIRQIDEGRRITPRIVQHRAVGGYECCDVDRRQLRGAPDEPVVETPARRYSPILLLGLHLLFRDPVEHGIDHQLIDRQALLREFRHDERKVSGGPFRIPDAGLVLLPQEGAHERPHHEHCDCKSRGHLECGARVGPHDHIAMCLRWATTWQTRAISRGSWKVEKLSGESPARPQNQPGSSATTL